VRELPGYRNLPILDGAEPPSREAFLDVIHDLRDVPGSILLHCDSGRGRAPTMAAALLIARGLAPDVDSALALVRAGRPVSSPSRVDVAFLCTVLPSLRVLQEHAGSVPVSDQMGRRNSRGRI
jgi:protein-tyrosine phosphatase